MYRIPCKSWKYCRSTKQLPLHYTQYSLFFVRKYFLWCLYFSFKKHWNILWLGSGFLFPATWISLVKYLTLLYFGFSKHVCSHCPHASVSNKFLRALQTVQFCGDILPNFLLSTCISLSSLTVVQPKNVFRGNRNIVSYDLPALRFCPPSTRHFKWCDINRNYLVR